MLDEARRAIDQQKKDLEGLRSRAGTTAGYATVVASVLGGLSLRDGTHPTAWTWTGFAALAVAAAASVFVLWPRTLTLALDIEKMDGRIDKGDGIAVMIRDTSLALYRDRKANQRVLNRLHNVYVLSLFFVLIELCFLLVDLARR
ncbi:hypothetical protein [Kribbella sp. NBC_00359]|uniref:hypothetical protein n=1 Tax=Kribbella sp. NBC_00359 TaxID=2975966 RepID=UPI002E1E3F9E